MGSDVSTQQGFGWSKQHAIDSFCAGFLCVHGIDITIKKDKEENLFFFLPDGSICYIKIEKTTRNKKNAFSCSVSDEPVVELKDETKNSYQEETKNDYQEFGNELVISESLIKKQMLRIRKTKNRRFSF
jgi:hypothetical protein